MDEEQVLLGASDHISKIMKQIDQAAINDMKTVFIEGPTGTGKEIIARKIHEASQRQGKPFIVVNSSELSGETHHSLMFGHERGSFTDARQQHIGYFERVGDGTLFLDEIGELPPEIQAKLLRVVENRKFLRIGGNTDIDFKARIIAATNMDTEEGMMKGNFRRDFFQRLNQFHIKTIPLSKRPEDVVCLINECRRIKKVDELGGVNGNKVDPRTKFLLYHYDFPGNIRELINLITSDYESVLEKFIIRKKSVTKEGSEQASSDQEAIEKNTLKQRRMERALKLLKQGISKKEAELISKLTPKRHPSEQWIKILTKVYEIIMLAERTNLSRDEIARILKIRRNRLTATSFKNEYCLVYPDKINTYKKIRYPVTLFARLKRILKSQ